MHRENFAGPMVGAPEDVPQDENMTFNYEGYAIMTWGSPSTQAVEWLDRVLQLESEPKLHVRGRFGTQLSRALINFVEHDLSEARVRYSANPYTPQAYLGCIVGVHLFPPRRK